MSRRFVLIAIVVVILMLFGGGVGGLYWSLLQAPTFYAEELQKSVPPEVQKAKAKEFVQATMQLVDEIKHEDEWSERFTQEQINSFLAEELPKRYAQWIPKGTSDPRVRLHKGSIEIGFRCEHPRFKGVISGRFKPFVSGPNELAIQVQSISLGLVPLPIDQILDQLGSQLDKAVADAGWKMEWRQLDGHDVLVLHLKNDEKHPVLEAVNLEKGALEISGRKFEKVAMTAEGVRN